MAGAYQKAEKRLLELTENCDTKMLYSLCRELSDVYRQKEKSTDGLRLHLNGERALAYALMRMSPTYAAARRAMELTAAEADLSVFSLLDVGAGTGSAYFAAKEVFDLGEACLIEREEGMVELLKELTQGEACSYRLQDMRTAAFQKVDLAVASYALLELSEADREAVLQRLYQAADTLILIEPGTRMGYLRICEYKRILKRLGAHMLAPCPDMEECRLKDDWCQFSVRIQRNQAIRSAKKAELGYEDENFLFLAVSGKYENADRRKRLIKRPKLGKAKAEYALCTNNGVEQKMLYKRDTYYKEAKKLRVGDRFLETTNDRT